MTGAVESIPDASATLDELVSRVAGFGPLQPLLDDPEVEEIWIKNPAGSLPPRPGA
ncbi:MAG: hypothetical protein R2693_10655 [Nocardioidaceae bacterium]